MSYAAIADYEAGALAFVESIKALVPPGDRDKAVERTLVMLVAMWKHDRDQLERAAKDVRKLAITLEAAAMRSR